MLVLTRTEGAVTYGGRALTADLDNSFDHRIRIERIVDDINERYAEVTITNAVGEERLYRLDRKKETVSLDSRVKLTLVSIGALTSRSGRFIPIVRIGIDAPRYYRVVRDDAVKKAG